MRDHVTSQGPYPWTCSWAHCNEADGEGTKPEQGTSGFAIRRLGETDLYKVRRSLGQFRRNSEGVPIR